jgi:two-component system OmpR family sensor kinase
MKLRRLSLRARLLVLLIAVTAAFLVVMGGVTTIVLSRRLNAQFNADLLAAAAAPAAGPPGDVAAAISVRTGQVVLLTPGGLGSRFEQTLEGTSRARLRSYYYGGQPFMLMLGDGTRLRAVEKVIRAAEVPEAGLPRGPVLLVVARPLSTLAGQVRTVVDAELITGAALLLLLGLGGRWLIGRGLAPLTQMAGTAQRITDQGDLAARMPDAGAGTEVGRLAAAINTMLDRIQQAFGARLASERKVRQFAADASHELRTPLTTIRGYAELYRQGALGPGQLPDAMRRIEQEARRMGTLVAELLELARLDRTSSLDLTETDLAALVRDAVADARAVEPRRPVTAHIPGRLVAVVDEARIRQVLANLLGNVREHTPPTAAAVVRLAAAPGGAVLEVADAGPGMAPQHAARAFDRFHRGGQGPGGRPAAQRRGPAGADGAGADAASADGSGTNGARTDGASADGASTDGASTDGGGGRDSGGSGLGLSIVQAIARAHGGEATLESQPGAGTRVRIWLPTGPPGGSTATPAGAATSPRPAPGP